jgi:hypothetical protein
MFTMYCVGLNRILIKTDDLGPRGKKETPGTCCTCAVPFLICFICLAADAMFASIF